MPASVLSRAVADFLVPWTTLPWPVDWAAQFGREAPLGLELGFGNGTFLEDAARRRPDMDWVGGEISWGSVRRLLVRLAERGVPNIRVFEGEGAFVLEHAFGPASLDEIYVNHPDPWPKKRHHGRRLVQPAFVDLAARRLRPGGRLTIVTDHAELADWIAEVLEAQAALRSAFPTSWVRELSDRTRTRYETKGLEAGSTIHYFVWERARAGGEEPPRVGKVETMPNVMLDGVLEDDVLLPGFEPSTWTEEATDPPTRIRLLAVYRRDAGRDWLVETLVQEGALRQHFALAVQPRRDDRVVVKPADLGVPRPTRGVKMAVRWLADLLLNAHPKLRVRSTSVGDLPVPPGEGPPAAPPVS